MGNDISFSKIVATPTINSWSQAYNAGKLFAVLSLEKTKDLPETESLNILGKSLLERLEKEFFVIEDKNLNSVKNAIASVFSQKTEGINISFAAGVPINNILYLFGLGNAKVFIKRNDNLGLLLDAQDSDEKNISTSSGFLKEKDLIVLTTDAFSEIITRDDLEISLRDDDPIQITESLAPKIHKSENGGISAIIIKYKEPLEEKTTEEEVVENDLREIGKEEKAMEEAAGSPFEKYFSFLKSKLKKPNLKIRLTKGIFMLLAIVISIIMIFGVLLSIRERNNAKIRALFAEIYPQAQKKYEEGQSLVDLNRNFARDSFLSAQKILKNNKDNFPAKSTESIQAQNLLTKVENGLAQVSPVDKSGLDRSKLSIAVENGSGVEGVAGKAAKILQDLGYNVASTGNADNYSYEGITIKTKSADSNFINLLKQDLSKEYTIKTTSSDLASNYSTNALVIIGK